MASSPVSSGSSTSTASSTPVPTRGRPSVQALLAELSDSDDDIAPKPKAPLSSLPSKSILPGPSEHEDVSSEDDLPVGGGRLASRLTGATAGKSTAVVHEDSTLQDARSSVPQRATSTSPGVNASASEEITPQPKKKFLLKRKRILEEDDSERLQRPTSSPNRRPAQSPQDSPTPTRSVNIVTRSPSPDIPACETETSASTGKSKFQALVEKARKEREAREQAEEAKKAARAAQMTMSSPHKGRPRGSSPADDSQEDSDDSQVEAAKRLTKDARPTRKASKKAIEEMNRETQRMTRNMQLAHQARTKKRYTKEGFFAGFTGSLPVVAETVDNEQIAQPSTSSAPSSDAESMNDPKLHSTPPTSPLRSPTLNKMSQRTAVDDVAMASGALQDDPDDTIAFEDIFASRRPHDDKPKTVLEGGIIKKTSKSRYSSTNPTLSVFSVNTHHDSDSGSEIEVVYDTGLKRKYAAFENLPKRKAKEMPSHLALRSLAHVRQSRDKKSTMSSAEIGPSLLKAARKQALQERQEKIEKLKAAGVVIQTAEEKEQDEEELENLVERARQQDEEIRKHEKELAKKDGTYVKDALDEDDSDDEDENFVDEDQDDEAHSGTDDDDEEDDAGDGEDGADEVDSAHHGLIDDAAEDTAEGSDSEDKSVSDLPRVLPDNIHEVAVDTSTPMPSRVKRNARIVLDDEEDEDDTLQTVLSPALPTTRKTPQSVLQSTRKMIPGLQHSDDLSIGLTQAFAATMAESQTQNEEATEEQDSMDILRDLPSPHINMMPRLNRFESLDMISESTPGTQTQPLGLDFGLSQTQRVPESPATTPHVAASQAPFELTQDAGYSFSPFVGNRFAESPRKDPQSTEETIILPRDEDSPFVQKKGRLQRGQKANEEAEASADTVDQRTAFQVMSKAAKRKAVEDFNKKQSEARRAVDEAAEESDDEYAGLGGASDDDSNDEENEEDRRMIDEDTQVGQGDEAKLAKLYADRERADDEAAVNKMMKDITTGALRRKRAVGDDLDLSDEEDATTRRRAAKRKEFEKMRRYLLKDEAVSKIADDKKKQAFLKSIEDHDGDDEDEDFDHPKTSPDVDSQDASQRIDVQPSGATEPEETLTALHPAKDSQLNQIRATGRRTKIMASRKPGTLAEIRESVSFLIEEPDSQASLLDLGLSDSEEEPEAYVNLDRHLQQAEADEDAMNDENEDLGDFIVDDEEESAQTSEMTFKKPELPTTQRDRAPFSERRTKSFNVVDRLSLLRQASSSTASTSSASSKMAFFSSKAGSGNFNNVPNLLRRATTNSGLGSMSGRENISATGVVTSKTERGSAAKEKDFVRKGASTSRNAVNYQGRQSLKEEKMSARAGIAKKQQKKKSSGFLGSLFRGDSWA